MLDERLFYFIHGIATMYFILSGLQRINKESATRLERFCGYLLLYWAFLELKDLGFYATSTFRNNYLSNILILIDTTAIPAGCFFVIELLHTGWFTLRRAILLVSPFLLSIFAYVFTAAEWIVDASFIFAGCYTILFFIQSLYLVRRYNRLLVDNFSNVEYLHVRWLKRVTFMLAMCCATWIASCFYSSWIVDSAYQLLLMLMWIVVLYYADKQQPIKDAHTLFADTEVPANGSLGNFSANRLKELMNEERVWLNPHLSLSDLATLAGTNRTYLSNYLNQTLGTTFYDYINHYRLEAALKQLNDSNSTATVTEIAEACGFNSLSTFRRVFMRAKGCTFAEYRQQVTSKSE